jgi:hypothetical protein
MKRVAVCVTLDEENAVWLKGRVGGGASRSVSELVDTLVTEARTRGNVSGARSVAGTIDIDSSDPMLDGADAAVTALFEQSVVRPLMVAERPARYVRAPARKHRG